MIIDALKKEDAIRDKLKKLAQILQNYQILGSVATMLLAGKIKSEEFNVLYDKIYPYYKESLDSYKIEDVIKIINSIEPTVIFLSKRRGENIDYELLIVQAIAFDLMQFFYKTDDFVCIPGEKYSIHKRLELKRDKDNLIHINEDFELKKYGIIHKNNKVIFYHPFLRRNFHANFTEIIDYIIELSKNNDIKIRLAIDPFRINDKGSLFNFFEKDYWRGPKFSIDKLNDLYFSGKAVYKRPNEHINNFWYPVDRIEVNTLIQERDKAVTIEEICPRSNHYVHGDNYHLNRFVHFVWDRKNQSFSHLDIAVIIHESANFNERFEKEFPGKIITNKDKIKIVRIDGIIPLDIVSNIIYLFFMNNELVEEYFTSK